MRDVLIPRDNRGDLANFAFVTFHTPFDKKGIFEEMREGCHEDCKGNPQKNYLHQIVTGAKKHSFTVHVRPYIRVCSAKGDEQRICGDFSHFHDARKNLGA